MNNAMLATIAGLFFARVISSFDQRTRSTDGNGPRIAILAFDRLAVAFNDLPPLAIAPERVSSIPVGDRRQADVAYSQSIFIPIFQRSFE